ncbi:hypothetical protein AB0I81_22765 [Nonomuraea sp. NPDC050404]|uniref:hypothetical protein n=1 Tax=Nonomuraea sp. NPDC050404 TaxID=3155783 RepID=UPI0033C00A47
MIIEDENGREWTTEELRDWDREPGEPEQREPLDLDWVRELIAKRNVVHADMKEQREAERLLLDQVLPELVGEVSDFREAEDVWADLPTRTEWAMTASANEPPGNNALWRISAEAAEQAYGRPGVPASSGAATSPSARPWPSATKRRFEAAVTALIVIAAIVTYLAIGLGYIAPRFVARDMENNLRDFERIATPERMRQWRREAAGFAIPIALIWPFYLTGRWLINRIVAASPLTTKELKLKNEELERRIADLERDTGIGP